MERTGNSVSYESAMGFGVTNPIALKGLEGLQSVGEDSVKGGIGKRWEIRKRYENAICKKGIEK